MLRSAFAGRGPVLVLALLGVWLSGVGGAAAREAIAVEQLEDFEFGRFVRGDSSGTAVMNTASEIVSTTGGVSPLGGIIRQAAVFRVTGEPGEDFYFTIPLTGSLITITNTGGLYLRIHTFTSNLAGGPNVFQGTLSGSQPRGEAIVRIGGTLDVFPFSSSGRYEGNYGVEVEYVYPE